MVRLFESKSLATRFRSISSHGLNPFFARLIGTFRKPCIFVSYAYLGQNRHRKQKEPVRRPLLIRLLRKNDEVITDTRIRIRKSHNRFSFCSRQSCQDQAQRTVQENFASHFSPVCHSTRQCLMTDFLLKFEKKLYF